MTTTASMFRGMDEVLGVLVGDTAGTLLESTFDDADSESLASETAVALNEIGGAGALMGFERLETLSIRGREHASLATCRSGRFLLVELDPSKSTIQVEKALARWQPTAAVMVSRSGPTTARRVAPPPVPAPFLASERARAATPPPVAPGRGTRPPTPAPTVASSRRAGETTSPNLRPPADEIAPHSLAAAYTRFRRCVVRGLLSEGALRSRQIVDTFIGDQGQSGCESLGNEQHEAATRALLEGVGSVLAGDCIGGLARLKELTEPAMRNVSFRWLALHWSVRAAAESGYVAGSVSFAQEALALADKLDLEARGISLLARAPALALQGKPGSALGQLLDARKLFHSLNDPWGLGQTWLAEARILASLDEEPQSTEAARSACAADPTWDEPILFLARRALMRGEVDEAERVLGALDTPGSERERALIGQIKRSAVTVGDAADFLRLRDTAPSAHAARVLERIALSSPRFVEAREELAWMLLKLGKYNDAGNLFRSLLSQELSQSTRASVMVGLGCIANARDKDRKPAARMHAAISPNAAAVAAAAHAAADPDLPALPLTSLLTEEPLSSGSRPMAVFSGELSEFPLPDLVEFLRSGRRSGLLVCSSKAGMGALSLRGGHVTGAASPGTPHIGRLLLESQQISEASLRAAIARQSNHPDRLLGAMLVHEGLVEAEAVRSVLRKQVDTAMREMVLWKEGQFTFANDTASDAARSTIDIELDPQVVLLNIFKQMDEENRPPPRPGASEI